MRGERPALFALCIGAYFGKCLRLGVHMYEYIRKHWLGISLKKKLGIYVCLVILVILVSVLFSFLLMDFALGNFNTILHNVLHNL